MQTDVVKVEVSCTWRIQPRIVSSLIEWPGAHASWDDQDLRCGHLVERGVDREAEVSVVGAHLTALGADEHDLGAGKALQHFVGTDGVERGDLREEQEGDLHLPILAIVGS